MAIRPVDIARELNISTSSLRHYEKWKMIPPVKRSCSGYRIYTDEHVEYFKCIRAMAEGFGILLASKVLNKIMARDVKGAFWLLNEAQADLHREKMISDKTMKTIMEKNELPDSSDDQELCLHINEMSQETGVPVTTIRHWEKTGLIHVPREKGNHYRIYYRHHLREILVIRALKASRCSDTYSLSAIKKILENLDYNDVQRIKTIALDFQNHLDKINRHQMHGIHQLYSLCGILGLKPGAMT